MSEEGFPKPKSEPVAANLFSEYGYLNTVNLPSLSNNLYRTLDASLKSKLTAIARCTFLLVYNDTPIGTAVLISPNIMITAGHCLDFIPDDADIFAVSGFLRADAECCYFNVKQRIRHPREDAALLVVSGNPAQQNSFIEYDLNGQPAGGYYIAHHAGGLALQVSSGQAPDFGGQHYLLQHRLLADAGPLASGAGMFDGASLKLTGINTARTIELGRISRVILPLDRIRQWLLSHVMPDLQAGINGTLQPDKVCLPPAPLTLDQTPAALFSNADESMTWVRAQLRVQQIRQFMDRLNQFLNGEISQAALVIPEQLRDASIMDGHQAQHLGTRSRKTRINPDIGSNVLNNRLKAVAIVISNVFSLFYLRVPAENQAELLSAQSEKNEWAVDLAPIVVGNASETTIARIDGDPLGSFHFYPIEKDDVDITSGSVNVIVATAVLDFVTQFRPDRPAAYYY